MKHIGRLFAGVALFVAILSGYFAVNTPSRVEAVWGPWGGCAVSYTQYWANPDLHLYNQVCEKFESTSLRWRVGGWTSVDGWWQPEYLREYYDAFDQCGSQGWSHRAGGSKTNTSGNPLFGEDEGTTQDCGLLGHIYQIQNNAKMKPYFNPEWSTWAVG